MEYWLSFWKGDLWITGWNLLKDLCYKSNEDCFLQCESNVDCDMVESEFVTPLVEEFE